MRLIKYFYLLKIIFLVCFSSLKAQNIEFTDLNLKALLVNEFSIDSDNNNIPDVNLDSNNDQEIQLSEALGAQILIIYDLHAIDYNIESFEDLSHFQNLQKLWLLNHQSLLEISNLGLPNLSELYIGSNYNMTHIDLSDMPGITHLRIEDLSNLDYLNLQNGTSASELFSLFYTVNIQYACVDSIASEYGLVASAMASGNSPSIVCIPTKQEVISTTEEIQVFPNPTAEKLKIISEKNKIEQLILFDSFGQVLIEKNNATDSIDLSEFPSGIYFLFLQTETGSFVQKVFRF